MYYVELNGSPDKGVHFSFFVPLPFPREGNSSIMEKRSQRDKGVTHSRYKYENIGKKLNNLDIKEIEQTTWIPEINLFLKKLDFYPSLDVSLDAKKNWFKNP